eukprot:gene13604-15016_t
MKHAASLTGLPDDEIKDCIAFMVESGYLDRNLTAKGEERYFICNNKVAAEEEMDSCDTTLGLGFGSFATPTTTSHHQTPQLKSPEANKTDFMVFLDVVAKLTDYIRSTNSSMEELRNRNALLLEENFELKIQNFKLKLAITPRKEITRDEQQQTANGNKIEENSRVAESTIIIEDKEDIAPKTNDPATTKKQNSSTKERGKQLQPQEHNRRKQKNDRSNNTPDATTNNNLKEIDWDDSLGPLSNDPCGMAQVFQDIFELLLNVHAPLGIRKMRNEYVPWLTSAIRKLMLKRDKMKKAATKNTQLWPRYKELRNRCTNAIRMAIREYYHGLIEENKNDPKSMWKTINRVLDRNASATSIASLNIDGKIVTGEREVAEALNQHFATIGPKLADKIENKPDDDPLLYITKEPQASSSFNLVSPYQ